MNPADIDISGADIVGFASSDREGVNHWTELGIFYLPNADGRCFLARVEGCSRIEGQSTRRRAVYVGTIQRALEFFDEGDLFDMIRVQAADWIDRNGQRVQEEVEHIRQRERRLAGAPCGFLGPGGLIGALRWLYYDEDAKWNENVLSGALAEDFGVPARTVRDALQKEREGADLPSWCRAFVAALMHFDRVAFVAAKGGK